MLDFTHTSMIAVLASSILSLIIFLICSFLDKGTLEWRFFFLGRFSFNRLTSVENTPANITTIQSVAYAPSKTNYTIL